jgi:hypothetical protein
MAKKVIIDVYGALVKKRENDFRYSLSQISRDVGADLNRMIAWDKEAPMVITIIYHLIKGTDKTFDNVYDKVKHIKNRPMYPVHAVYNLCNQTGLTFEELVKEV